MSGLPRATYTTATSSRPTRDGDPQPERDAVAGQADAVVPTQESSAEAAAVTSLARYAARVTALDGAPPAHIFDRVGAALEIDSSDLFCTMAIVRGDRSSGKLVVSLAGHPQVRIVGPDGVRRVGRFGSLLGMGGRTHHEVVDELAPGEAAVLFSDGLIERSERFAEDELDQALAGLAGLEAGALANRLQQAILAVPPQRADDLAVLVVARTAG